MNCKSGDAAMPALGLAGVKNWIVEAWPTALPLCALLVASIAPVAVLAFSIMGSSTGAIASLISALAVILSLSLISRLSLQRNQPAS